ncbi:MAG: hypothetical protein JWP82_1085 [Humibacillus sp.]|nr:hypothetical protein [Humibacillus sp.]
MSDATGRRRSVEPATLRALAATRARTRELSDDLLGHLPDVGDLTTQRLLDAWVEQAADTLRALSEAAEERLLELGRADVTGVSGDEPPPVGSPSPSVSRPGVGLGPLGGGAR